MQLRQRLEIIDLRLLDRGRADGAGIVHEVRNLEARSDAAGRLGQSRVVEQINRERVQLGVRFLRRLTVEHDDLVAGVEQVLHDRGADAGGAASDDGDMAFGHESSSTSAKTRKGLPEPCLILSGADTITAPFGGSLSRLVRHCRP